MREETRVCVVLCKRVGSGYRFCVLERKKGWEGWELVKGHIDSGDDPRDAALREVEEETGIAEGDIERVKPLDYTLEWTYEDENGEQVRSVCDCFLMEVDEHVYVSVDQNPHDEHSTGHFLNFRDAHDILTYDNQRELLRYIRDNRII